MFFRSHSRLTGPSPSRASCTARQQTICEESLIFLAKGLAAPVTAGDDRSTKVRKGEEAAMTTRPHLPSLPLMIAGGHSGRHTGNVAVPDTNHHPREGACRKDFSLS